MKNTIQIDSPIIKELKPASAITVNTTHGENNSIEKAKKLFNPQVESMEGAAFFYACLFEAITCSQIRTISNKVEKRSKENWDLPLAIQSLNNAVVVIIAEL